MVLGRLGRTENSPSKSVCSILPIAICGPGSYGAPAFILSFAALFGFPSSARPSLCAPSALHGTSDGATMFAPGGAGTTPRTVFDNSFVLGATGFYHRVGASCPSWLRPFALLRLDRTCSYQDDQGRGYPSGCLGPRLRRKEVDHE